MDLAEQLRLIQLYKDGPAALRDAWDRAPIIARGWQPAEGEWSANEIIAHCADAEISAAARIRLLIAETNPIITGFDQAAWSVVFDYQSVPADLAFAVIEATRAYTGYLLASLTERDWRKTGTHTQAGNISAHDWLAVYGEHLHVHARQINENMHAWAIQAADASEPPIQ